MNILNLPNSIDQNFDSPTYLSPEYKKLLPQLEFVADMWQGRTAWVRLCDLWVDYIKSERYLPKETEESTGEYNARLLRSYFSCKFRHAIEGFAGYLSRFTVSEDVHPTISERKENIDLKGNSLEVFFRSCDEMALRDEHCFVLVEFPVRPPVQNYQQEKELKLMPYLVKIDARSVINWSIEANIITQVTIKEKIYRREGRFGSKEVIRYRVLTPGAFEIYEAADHGSEHALALVEEGKTTLTFIPIVAYTLTSDTEIFTGEPPLYDLAELNLKHYQKTSEKDEVMHKCNIPFLQMNETTPIYSDDPSKTKEIRIGANTILKNVNCSFIEPSGSALNTTQQDIAKLEAEINERTLNFLSGISAPRTATEVSLQSSATQSNLINWARRKESNIQRIFQYWSSWVGGDTQNVGSITVEDDLLNQAISDARVNFLVQLQQTGNLSTETLLTELRTGGVLEDLDVEAELDRIAKSAPQPSAGGQPQ